MTSGKALAFAAEYRRHQGERDSSQTILEGKQASLMNETSRPGPATVAAVIATYNRKDDLVRCLGAVRGQSIPPDEVIVINNASDDDTTEFLARQIDCTVVTLSRNVGGAGAFDEGLQRALVAGHDWIWLMDDDCVPDAQCLAGLRTSGSDVTAGALGAVAPVVHHSDGLQRCGFRQMRAVTTDSFGASGEMAGPVDIDWAPFTGLLLSGQACTMAGSIRSDFFIWNDDREYCLRLRTLGFRILGAPEARVFHPVAVEMSRKLLGRTVTVHGAPPWKEYYAARNSLFVERLYKGTPFVSDISLARRLIREVKYMAKVVCVDPKSGLRRSRMRVKGVADALYGRSGPRVTP